MSYGISCNVSRPNVKVTFTPPTGCESSIIFSYSGRAEKFNYFSLAYEEDDDDKCELNRRGLSMHDKTAFDVIDIFSVLDKLAVRFTLSTYLVFCSKDLLRSASNSVVAWKLFSSPIWKTAHVICIHKSGSKPVISN